MRHFFLSAILALTITGCGYDGHYRYPCQDPANWEAPECNPPICKATGTCTEDLIGYDPNEATEEITEQTSDEITSDIIEETKKEPLLEDVDNINDMVNNISGGN